MLERMFETASKLFILVLITNAAFPVVPEQTVNNGSSQTDYFLIYLTKLDNFKSSHILNKTFATDENQRQFCINTSTSERRQILMYEANEFQVNVSKMEVNLLDSITLNVIVNISGNISCYWIFKERAQCNVNYCTMHSQVITFTISRMREMHSGIYTLTVESENTNYTISFPIFVRAKPKKPKMIMKKEGNTTSFECSVESYPAPELTWLTNCSSSVCQAEPTVTVGMRRTLSEMKCHHCNECCCARNILGSECSSLYTQDLDIESSKESSVRNVFLKVGDPFLLRCVASCETYRFRINWINDTKAGNITEVLEDEASSISPNKFTRVKLLFISSVHLEHSGSYTCGSTSHPNKTVKLEVLEEGFINSTTTNSTNTIGEAENFCFEVELKAFPLVRCQWYFSRKALACSLKELSENRYSASLCGNNHEPGIYEFFAENEETEFQRFVTIYIKKKPSLELALRKNNILCKSTSHPSATVTWKKCNGNSCVESENVTEGIQTIVSDGKEFGSKNVMSLLDTTDMTGGFSIECCAGNAVGSVCKKTYLPEQGTSFRKFILYMTVGIFVPVTFLLIVFIFYKYQRQPGYERQLHMIQVVGSSENDYIYVDFTHIDYDIKWEFPRENLELGNVLGSGAFGKVMEATAYGISKADVPVQVAVKMLKEKYEPSEKDALMSELKMMIHMGRHENIVNLLGACTISGPVYLIFEYCCYGDLLNYLRNNREKFHKTLTDIFAHNNFSFYHNLYNDERCSYKTKNFLQNETYVPMNREPDAGMLSEKSDCDLLFCEGELTCPLTSEINYQNTRRYEDEDIHVLTFDDLLSFSYQVAKGMEFLTSQSCIHRDLAARNVLVTHGKVAKICDFGLARDIMQDSNYVVRGNARLPVKWMAPESLFEGSYTIRSDVWSYGILLWEIFSLGVNPYPGIQVDTNFYKLIRSGFKMDQPFYATEEIYNVIQSCWALDPGKRLVFSDLVSIFEKQLADAEVAVSEHSLTGRTDNIITVLDIKVFVQKWKNVSLTAFFISLRHLKALHNQ
ncbi:receptor-type tyrosine-protein kinase FLT3 isoform X2 [Scyliorhinus canicula]|uniref:receptor-type tyrosine-protein kinase FLT3 isoform X2 n=1 Tax=Scyliorhinus canicula TaxID=7830 RepID=UPI0018F29637|nr:receptor-type tyrosine-protein kinase FLT3 isoform X2 [Scyliorhinus canicula]